MPGIGCCVVQLGGLRKLHLTLEDSYRTDNCFAQLAKLSQLRFLALQCQQCDVSCANVILSNQATLGSITLASCSWSVDTYAALNKASVLTVLSVRVNVVTESDARKYITWQFEDATVLPAGVARVWPDGVEGNESDVQWSSKEHIP